MTERKPRWIAEVTQRGVTNATQLCYTTSEDTARTFFFRAADVVARTGGTGLVILRRDGLAVQQSEYSGGELVAFRNCQELARERGEEIKA